MPRAYWFHCVVEKARGLRAGIMSDITLVLSTLERGESHAAAELYLWVYDELRRLQPGRLAGERPVTPPCHGARA